MSIALPTVDMSAAIVGTTGNISLKNAGITSYPSQQNKATLHLYNESGFGLYVSFSVSASSDYIPARGRRAYLLAPGESQLNYRVLFANPSTPVQLLIPVVYLPSEPVPDLPQSSVDFNQYNTGGLTTPLTNTASAFAGTPPTPISLAAAPNKTTYIVGFILTSDKPAGAIVYEVAITNTIGSLNLIYFLEATSTVTALLDITFPFPIPAAAANLAITATVTFASGAANNTGVFLNIFGYQL